VKAISKTFQYGEHEVTMETGAIARQADGAVLVKMAETEVLVTAVGRKEADPGRDFFPLTVTQDVGEYGVIIALFHEAHGNTCNRGFYRNTRVHQR